MNQPWPPDLTRCLDCGRRLDQADDPLSESVGYDCAACAVLHDMGHPPPTDLGVAELQDWLKPYLAAAREWRDMLDAALRKATPTGKASEMDMGDFLLLIATLRLVQQGVPEDEACVKAEELLSKPLPFRLLTFDEL